MPEIRPVGSLPVRRTWSIADGARSSDDGMRCVSTRSVKPGRNLLARMPGLFRRMLHARATGDGEKLDRATAVGTAIRAEKADALRTQTRRRVDALLASRPYLASARARE